MKAVVTGGGGFLGGRMVEMLHARGDTVIALGRRTYPHLEAAGIRTVQADIRDLDALVSAFRDADVVFHVAALAAVWGKRRLFWDVNVRGTQNVIAACRQQGVGRLVYTSTPSVVFGKQDLCGVDESQPYPRKYLTPYAETKAIAERAVLAANGPKLATVALRPHLIWGPGDPHLIPRVIERARRGQLVQVGDGKNLVDITYIDNAAEAHVRAAQVLSSGRECPGRAFFISQGEPVSLWPWLSELLEAVGAPRPTRTIPFRSAYLAGAVLELAYRALALEREPKMTRFISLQLAKNHYFDISAARWLVGYEPVVTTEEGLQRLVRDLKGAQSAVAATAAGI